MRSRRCVDTAKTRGLIRACLARTSSDSGHRKSSDVAGDEGGIDVMRQVRRVLVDIQAGIPDQSKQGIVVEARLQVSIHDCMSRRPPRAQYRYEINSKDSEFLLGRRYPKV
jgi:hypothetical protein